MCEEYTVIMFPEFEKLLKKCEQLRTEFSMLLLEKDQLLYKECKNIESAYLLNLGGLEYKLYELECEMLRLRRKIELIQIKINRQERVNLSAVENQLDEEFAEYKQKLEEQIEKMNQAIEHSKCQIMSEGEVKEFKKLYRAIVKALHPDINKNVTAAQIQLFENAVLAYKNGDIKSLRLIGEMVSEPKLPEKSAEGLNSLLEEIDHLEACIKAVNEQMVQIKSEYPYILKGIIESPEKTAERRAELNNQIEGTTQAIEYYKSRIEGMLGK